MSAGIDVQRAKAVVVFLASAVAAFAGAISNAFAGSGQELLNAGVLIIAVVSLTWHNVWMAEHGRELVAALRHQTRQGSAHALGGAEKNDLHA